MNHKSLISKHNVRSIFHMEMIHNKISCNGSSNIPRTPQHVIIHKNFGKRSSSNQIVNVGMDR